MPPIVSKLIQNSNHSFFGRELGIAKNDIETGTIISHEYISEEKKESSIFSSIDRAIEVSINKGKRFILIYVNTRKNLLQ